MSNAVASTVEVEVHARDSGGKNACRRMRKEGLIPANVYGMDRPPFMVAVNPKRIDEVLRLGRGVNTIFMLRLKGETRTREAMIRELQRDPLTDRALHVDFVRVDATSRLQVAIPVRLIGIPLGVKNDGGVLDFVHREVQVSCLPLDIPEHLDVDVSELHINQHVSIGDLTVGEAVTVLDDADQIIAVVSAPRLEEEAVEEEAEEAEEKPEAAKGKDETEGGATEGE